MTFSGAQLSGRKADVHWPFISSEALLHVGRLEPTFPQAILFREVRVTGGNGHGRQGVGEQRWSHKVQLDLGRSKPHRLGESN